MNTGKLFWLNIKSQKYIIIIGGMGLYLYILLMLLEVLLPYRDLGNTLQLSSYLVQSGMLVSTIIGYHLGKKYTFVESLYVQNLRIIFKAKTTDLLFLLKINTFFVTSLLVLTSLYYAGLSTVNAFYTENILFLLNYLLLPMLVSGLVAYIIASSTKSFFSISFVLVIWATLSPTNILFLQSLFASIGNDEAFAYLSNLNLGVQKIDSPYDDFRGFEFQWSKKLLLVVMLTAISFISMLQVKIRKSLTIFCVLLTLLLAAFIPNSTEDISASQDKIMEDLAYYSSTVHLPEQNTFNYNISNYKVDVVNSDQFKVKATLTIQDIRDSRISFTLYRGFKVTSVQTAQNEELDYEQKEDFTTVSLPNSFDKEKLVLTVSYEGSSANSYPVEEKNVYLTSNFPWLPKNERKRTFIVHNGELILSNFNDQNDVNYQLQYDGKENLEFVNLKKTGEKRYEGKGSGISLIEGNLSSMQVDDIDVIYPSSWLGNQKQLENFFNELNQGIMEYNSLFDMNIEPPAKVVLVPNMNWNDTFMFSHSLYEDQTLILQINPVEITQKISLDYQTLYLIDNAYNPRNFENRGHYTNWLLYNASIAAFLSEEEGLSFSKEYNEFNKELALIYFDESVSDSKKKWDIPDKHLHSKEFLQRWSNLLNETEIDHWMELDKILKGLE